MAVGGMGRLTLADVRTGDPEAFRAAAIAWAALATDLDAAHERLMTGRQRAGDAGHGATIAAATVGIGAHERTVGATVLPARRIAQALLTHADDLAALQRHLETLLASAQAAGLTIDARTGCVATPPAVSPDRWRVVNQLRDGLLEVLARARRLDAATAAVIRASRPGPDPSETARPDRATVQRHRGRPPADVYAWWQSLDPQQREWARRDHPDLIGGLDGIPAADRDRANREYLDRLIAQGCPPAGLVAVRDGLAVTPEAYLLLLDGSGDGRVAVALGDPDRARHTVVFVPGVGADLPDLPGEVARASTLRRVADQTTPVGGDVSVVYWLGYDPPDSLLDGWREGPSRDGGAALTRFVEGLRVTHGPDPSHLTVLGHSYGSTVVAEGARSGGLRADDIVAVGSPGLHSDHARELNLDPRHVWVGRSASDEIRFVPEPIHGREPADPGFGANRFATDTSGHSGYWRPGSDSLLNQAYIVTGQYDRVTLVHGQRPI